MRERERETHTHRQTDRQTNRQTDRQTDRQRQKETEATQNLVNQIHHLHPGVGFFEVLEIGFDDEDLPAELLQGKCLLEQALIPVVSLLYQLIGLVTHGLALGRLVVDQFLVKQPLLLELAVGC